MHFHRDRAMNKYDFALILGESLELTDDIADALFAAGCDDGTRLTCGTSAAPVRVMRRVPACSDVKRARTLDAGVDHAPRAGA